MTNTDEARRAVQETIEQLGGIDIVLANAVSAARSRLALCALAECIRDGPSSATGRTMMG